MLDPADLDYLIARFKKKLCQPAYNKSEESYNKGILACMSICHEEKEQQKYKKIKGETTK